MTREFVHLHNHSEHSALDGYSPLDEMVGEAARLGQPAFAVTDHGNHLGWHDLQKAAQKHGIKPIYGIEAYMAPTTITRHDHQPAYYGHTKSDGKPESGNDVSGRGAYTHLTMLARTQQGFNNLIKINKLAHKEGYYQKPRADIDLIAQHAQGLIITTGCPSGEIQTRLNLGQHKEALQYAANMQDIVGRENFFLEIMNHEMSIDLERQVIPKLLDLGKKLNLPIIATNDTHYARKEQAGAHECMLCIQTDATLSTPTYDQGGKRFAFNGDGYYIKSGEEMARLFPEDQFPGALSNTLLVAEMVEPMGMSFNGNLRPTVEVPDGYDIRTWFRHKTFTGAQKRWGTLTEEITNRLEYEIDIVFNKGFADYYLVVSDFIRWAKEQGIAVGPCRGSGGGSAAAYALDITEIDPIKHNLVFERFLNPERDSPPDFDIDFDDTRRVEVINYVREKYGDDHVASIATIGRFAIKQSLTDAARITETPHAILNTLKEALPPAQAGKEPTFDDICEPAGKRYAEGADFRAAIINTGSQNLINTAKGFIGRVRSTGVHAAGIIISSDDISNHIPVVTSKKDPTGAYITAFDYPTCESLGFIKFDFLGLKNLTIITDALKNIKKTRGITLTDKDIYHSALDDKKAYKLLAEGKSVGVFQLDGGGMRELLIRMRPTEFADIEAILALYRPGPMGMNSHNEYADRKNGITPITYPHPELEEPLKEVLGSTYGLCIYQEQVMKIAQIVSGYSLGQADELRRAMGKKKKEVLDREYIPFSEGAKKNGYSPEAIQILWDILIPFSDYGFNKSHASGYGLISYATAYLKANYPAEYMAAVLANEDDPDKVFLYLHEAKTLNLNVLPPRLNEADQGVTASTPDTIVFGLGSVRGFSVEKSETIIAERKKSGKYTSIGDFVSRVDLSSVNKTALDALTHAGAFDEFGFTRRTLINSLPAFASGERRAQKKKTEGQEDLFSIAMVDDDDLREQFYTFNPPNLPEYKKMEKLAAERKVIGMYLSDHPLSNIKGSLSTLVDRTIISVISDPPTQTGWKERTPDVSIGGIISSIEIKRTKKGDEMAIVTLEDHTASIEAVVFSRTLNDVRHLLTNDRVVILTGNASRRGDSSTVTMMVSNIKEIPLDDEGYIPFNIRLVEEQVTPASMHALSTLLTNHLGENSPLHINVINPTNRQVRPLTELHDVLGEKPFINPTRSFVSQLRGLFGVNCIGTWQ